MGSFNSCEEAAKHVLQEYLGYCGMDTLPYAIECNIDWEAVLRDVLDDCDIIQLESGNDEILLFRTE